MDETETTTTESEGDAPEALTYDGPPVTPGRAVHVFAPGAPEVYAGTVAFVHQGSDTGLVNIGALNHAGLPISFTSVQHASTVDPTTRQSVVTWDWPARA